MPIICKRRQVLALLFLLVCSGVWLLLPLTSQSQEAGAKPGAAGPIADEIRRLMTEGENPKAAILLATKYLTEHPEKTMERQRVHYELAAAHFHNGDTDAALATFTEIVTLYANAQLDRSSGEYRVDDALYFVGMLKGAKGDRAAAMACFEELIQQFPQSNYRPRAMLDLGNMRIEDGKAEEGLKVLEALVAQHPDSEFAPAAICRMNMWLLSEQAAVGGQSPAENVAKAKANIDTLLAKYPDSPEVWSALRELAWHLGTSARFHLAGADAWAEHLFATVTGDMDKFAAAESADVGALADTLRVLGRHDQASQVLETLIERYPQSGRLPRAMLDLGNMRLEDGKAEEGLKVLEALAAQHPDSEFARVALCRINTWLLSDEAAVGEQSRAENVAKAKANIDTLLAKYPASPEVWSAFRELAWHLGTSDRFHLAQADVWAEHLFATVTGDMDRFAAMESADVSALADTLRALGRHDQALQVLETLVEQYPQSSSRPRAMLDLGSMRIDDGKAEEGLGVLKALVAQHPDSESAPAAICRTNMWLLSEEANVDQQSRAENVEKARANVDILLAKYPNSSQVWLTLHDVVWHIRHWDNVHLAESDVWARHLFVALAGDMDRFAAIGAVEAGTLNEALRVLGRPDLASLVSGAQRISGGDLDGLSSRRCPDAICGLVLNQVALAEAADRRRVWDIGRPYIADSIDQLSDRTFDILDGLVRTMESNPTLAEAIITDLAGRTRDAYDTLPQLQWQLTDLALQRRIGDAPSDVQKSFWQARELQSKGDLAGATASLRAIVDESACPSDIRDTLNRRVVALLLQQQTDLAALDEYLPALRRQGEALDAEAWNLLCRALFRRVAVAKDDRARVWKDGLGTLAARTIVVQQRTVEDLDKLTGFLGRDSGDLALTIVTDLLLCAPDGCSMRRLQWRRIAMLAEAGDLDGAVAAAAMGMALTASSGRTVTPSLERFEELLRSGGATETDIAQTAAGLLCGSTNDAATQPAMRFVDEPLRKAAREALKLSAASENPRRAAYLNLLAGNTDKALLTARDCLLGCTDAHQATEALGDIYVMLAAADGSLARANRFADWLGASSNAASDQPPPRADDKQLAILAGGNWQAETAASSSTEGQPFSSWFPEDRAAVARAFSSQLAEELAASAQSAMDRGNRILATGLWALTLRGTAAPDTVRTTLDTMIRSLSAQMKRPDVRQFLHGTLPLVPALPHRRIVLVRMANLAHEEQLFDDCLDLLDEADALNATAGQEDFAVALLRASAMMELEDYDGADKLLAEAAGWDGTDENKAQCLFVTACLRLRQGRMKDARETLRTLAERYPHTSVATKASQLADRIK
jgi:TolA-binding protein